MKEEVEEAKRDGEKKTLEARKDGEKKVEEMKKEMEEVMKKVNKRERGEEEEKEIGRCDSSTVKFHSSRGQHSKMPQNTESFVLNI